MLVDKATEKTYSSGCAARRELGTVAFNKKVKNNELQYVKCTFVK